MQAPPSTDRESQKFSPLKLFFSYSIQDNHFAHGLTGRLEAEGFSVWYGPKVEKAAPIEYKEDIRSCNWFLLLLSPASVASEMVFDETRYAAENQKAILPILILKCKSEKVFSCFI